VVVYSQQPISKGLPYILCMPSRGAPTLTFTSAIRKVRGSAALMKTPIAY